jgi:hypothetical protein
MRVDKNKAESKIDAALRLVVKTRDTGCNL